MQIVGGNKASPDGVNVQAGSLCIEVAIGVELPVGRVQRSLPLTLSRSSGVAWQFHSIDRFLILRGFFFSRAGMNCLPPLPHPSSTRQLDYRAISDQNRPSFLSPGQKIAECESKHNPEPKKPAPTKNHSSGLRRWTCM
jgi:hypothetical protein